MAPKIQTVRGVSSNLITGTAALFYNKVSSIEPLVKNAVLSANNVLYNWEATTDSSLGWSNTATATGTTSNDTSVFRITSSAGKVENWEVPNFITGSTGAGESYAYTLENAAVEDASSELGAHLLTLPGYGGFPKNRPFGTIGYTTNGMSITFTPEWGEIQVDQLLDAARIFKTGQTATLNTTIAEATLENLAIALAVPKLSYPKTDAAGNTYMNLTAGNLYDCPTERSLVAIGPGKGGCAAGQSIERVYTAYRSLSQDAVTVSMSRNDPQTYDAAFRLMPNDNGSYGRVVDRLIESATQTTAADPYNVAAL